MVNDKKNIIILGAGFAGIRIAQDLPKKLKDYSYNIILVDSAQSHVFLADLYEVATAFNKNITHKCLLQLKETVAIPIKKLIDPKKVEFIHDAVTEIDPTNQNIKLKKGKSLSYEYLVVALGSETNYFNISGLKEHSFPLKTVKDALAINCNLDHFFHDLWKNKEDREVNITIGGGGATGVETAAELIGALNNISKKYDYPREKIKVQLVEGSDKLVSLPPKGTEIIKKRMEALGIKLHLERFISEVSKNKIVLKKPNKESEKIESDFLIWTGGVQVNSVVQKYLGEEKKGGAISVTSSCKSKAHKNIFAAGDNAYFENPKKHDKRLPLVARTAYRQGTLVAENIVRAIKDQPLKSYKTKTPIYLVPLGGKTALCKFGNRIGSGHLCWILRRLVTLKYSFSILPFFYALKRWLRGSKIFQEND